MIDIPLHRMGVVPGDKILVDVLNEASRLLQMKGWSRIAMARSASGQAVSLNSADASSYCLSGALVKAWRTIDPKNEDLYFPLFEKKLSAALRDAYGYEGGVSRWNDEVAASRDDVVTLINSVIVSIQPAACSSQPGSCICQRDAAYLL
ncbi:conserved hypothetical protein [Methylocella tundrae]|uniref:Uncharacterized protein n=1 Tax=Methylocella tundrae TaxID=227605 RepID=A0A8B6MAK4_METTU|nr:hypothetical protein [Methylocella tundrae]VTZ28587.1 conserved hypothetical protein [Methylocella tundrae]VTZ51309.1 conserved hypothetical protein [Methylocella tundrae]